MTTFQEKQFGQLRPANTTAVSIYSPGANITGIVKNIVIANTTATAETFRIFLDDNGATYDQTTSLFYDVAIDANSTIQLDVFYPMNDSTGNLAIRTSTASALTFTVFGSEVDTT